MEQIGVIAMVMAKQVHQILLAIKMITPGMISGKDIIPGQPSKQMNPANLLIMCSVQ